MSYRAVIYRDGKVLHKSNEGKAHGHCTKDELHKFIAKYWPGEINKWESIESWETPLTLEVSVRGSGGGVVIRSRTSVERHERDPLREAINDQK